MLEIDGGFHMDAQHWAADIARERALIDPSRIVIPCSASELRNKPGRVAGDLRRLGVGSSLAGAA